MTDIIDPTPAPAAPVAPVTPPADPAPAPAPAAPVDPAPAPTPAPRTQDPVDHTVPAVDPAAPVVPAPADPAADPNTPDPNAPAADPAAPVDPDAAALAGDVEDEDEQAKQIREAAEADKLPSGVNPDGTIDPLVYAYDTIPEIKVMGKVGVKGEVKEFVVKTAEDLPDDFRFADGKAQATFNGALANNMAAAQEAINDANAYNADKRAGDQRREQLVAQKGEVEQLQKDGKLPAFALKPTDPNFMQDPGAVRAQQVLDHMKVMNKEFSDAGSNQRVTSVALALRDLEATEAIAARDGRTKTITDTRNGINAKVNGGNPPAAPTTPVSGQHVHKDVNSALKSARKQHGL